MRIRDIAVVSVCLVSLLGGCTARDGGFGNASQFDPIQRHLQSEILTPDKVKAWISDYEGLDGAVERKAFRDQKLNQLLAMADYQYFDFELRTSTLTRAQFAASDITVLALTTAATVTGGEQAKSVLAGLAAILTGGRAIVNKEVLSDQTMPLLFSRARALRKEKLVDIETKMLLPDAQYSLYRGIGDVYEYFHLGTLTAAMSAIAEDNAEKLKEANNKAAALNAQRVEDLR